MQEELTFKKIDSLELLQEAFRLRCQSDHPEGFETDEFDSSALHYGAFDFQQQIVGAVRLILPLSRTLPIEAHCPGLDFDPLIEHRGRCAEISRLTIGKLHRHQSREEQPTQYIRRVSPIALGLFDLLYEDCCLLGISYCLAMMEKPLWLLLKLHGFIFKPIGPQVDFYGLVTPCLIDVKSFRGVHNSLQIN